MARKEVPFIDLIKEAWPFFTSNLAVTLGGPAILMWVPMIVVGLPVCIVAFVVGASVGFMNKNLIMPAMIPVGLVGVPLFAMAYSAVRAGWTIVLLKMLRGEPVSISDLKTGVPWFWNMFFTCFIVGVATAIGGLCLLIPGLFIMVRTSFASYLVVDENLGPIEALKRSNELATGYSWQLLGYQALLFFANLVFGAIPLANFVLPIAAMGFFDIVLARIYLYRIGEEPDLDSVLAS